jgi:hypothetical protein
MYKGINKMNKNGMMKDYENLPSREKIINRGGDKAQGYKDKAIDKNKSIYNK